MDEDLRAIGLRIGGVDHGFGPVGAEVAPGFHLVRAKQVHGTAILAADGTTGSPAGEADGLLTDSPGVAVAIATADCVPVLVAAPGVVAAVHAGWRGMLAGIVPGVLDRLRERHGIGPSEVRVALGPSIDGCCFEIEREIAARFADRWGEAVWRHWREGGTGRPPGRGTLDLRGVGRRILVENGVTDEAIEFVGPCTFCGDGPFASYRRDGANAGRQWSWIGLDPTRETRDP